MSSCRSVGAALGGGTGGRGQGSARRWRPGRSGKFGDIQLLLRSWDTNARCTASPPPPAALRPDSLSRRDRDRRPGSAPCPSATGATTLIAAGARSSCSASACAPTASSTRCRPRPTTRTPTTPSPRRSTTEGSFGGPEFETPATGPRGRRCSTRPPSTRPAAPAKGRRGSSSCCSGSPTILVVFSSAGAAGSRRLGRARPSRRLRGSPSTRPFIHSAGALMSEPPAMLTLPAAVLAFLWAGGPPSRWPQGERSSPQGATARAVAGPGPAVRPDGDVPARVPLRRRRLRRPRRDSGRPRPRLEAGARRRRPLLVVALLLPIVPWTIRNQVVLDRTCRSRPAAARRSTSAPSSPPTANTSGSRRSSPSATCSRDLRPTPKRSNEVDPTPLFDRVAARYPDLPRDSALGKVGKENFSDYFGEDPVGYLAMTARKVGGCGASGIGEAMSSGRRAGRADAARRARPRRPRLLALRRRWWELVAMATPIALVTAVGAVSLAAPRRNEVLMTLVFPLAAAALSRGTAALSSGAQMAPPSRHLPRRADGAAHRRAARRPRR